MLTDKDCRRRDRDGFGIYWTQHIPRDNLDLRKYGDKTITCYFCVSKFNSDLFNSFTQKTKKQP